MKITKKTKVKRNNKVIFKEIDETIYILDSKNTTIHTLNETASFIWKQLKRPLEIKELTDLLCKNYKVEKKRAVKDISEFIKKYIKQEFIIAG
jgi:hypothetical protein